MISKELLSDVLGKGVKFITDDIDYIESEYDEIYQVGDVLVEFFNDSGFVLYKRFNIHELAHKCKEWAKDNGYYLLSGFNKDIIEGHDIDFYYKETSMFETFVYQLVYTDKPEMILIGVFGSDENSDIKACQWILENK